MVSQKKNNKIANLRALAIITVVLGHSMIIYSSSWNIMSTVNESGLFDRLKWFINLYQMELYFFISGFLFYKTVCKDIPYYEFIKGKIRRLLVPYFCFGLLWMLPIKIILNIPSYRDYDISDILYRYVIGFDNGHLWFLYALFTIFVILYAFNRVLIKRKWGALILILCMFLMIKGININVFNVSSAVKYMFWFQLGYVLNSMTKQRYNILILSVLLFMAFLFSGRNMFVLTLLIVAFLYCVVPDKEFRWLSEIDRHSYGIYLFHSPLIYITYTYIFRMSIRWLS